jgi:hypothetical protein
MEHLLLEPGDALKLRCDTPTRPGGAVTWFKGAGRVPHSPRIQMRGVVMEIADVTYEDSGVYVCVCRGTRQPLRNFTITVAGRYPPPGHQRTPNAPLQSVNLLIGRSANRQRLTDWHQT